MRTVSLVFDRTRKVAEFAFVRFGIDTIALPTGETVQLVEACGGAFRTFVK